MWRNNLSFMDIQIFWLTAVVVLNRPVALRGVATLLERYGADGLEKGLPSRALAASATTAIAPTVVVQQDLLESPPTP